MADKEEFTDKDPRAGFVNGTAGVQGAIRYPLDLEDQSPHYIIFYPLVREDSRLGKSFKNAGAAVFDKSAENVTDPKLATKVAAAQGAGIALVLVSLNSWLRVDVKMQVGYLYFLDLVV